MGISTITAGRIFKGQKRENNGEEEVTCIDRFDHVGLAKVTNPDTTALSAGFIKENLIN
jgi:hypothetical protein